MVSSRRETVEVWVYLAKGSNLSLPGPRKTIINDNAIRKTTNAHIPWYFFANKLVSAR